MAAKRLRARQRPAAARRRRLRAGGRRCPGRAMRRGANLRACRHQHTTKRAHWLTAPSSAAAGELAAAMTPKWSAVKDKGRSCASLIGSLHISTWYVPSPTHLRCCCCRARHTPAKASCRGDAAGSDPPRRRRCRGLDRLQTGPAGVAWHVPTSSSPSWQLRPRACSMHDGPPRFSWLQPAPTTGRPAGPTCNAGLLTAGQVLDHSAGLHTAADGAPTLPLEQLPACPAAAALSILSGAAPLSPVRL